MSQDPRHTELMVRSLALESAKGVSTPGVKPTDPTTEAMKEGTPEPWDDSFWQQEDGYSEADGDPIEAFNMLEPQGRRSHEECKIRLLQ